MPAAARSTHLRYDRTGGRARAWREQAGPWPQGPLLPRYRPRSYWPTRRPLSVSHPVSTRSAADLTPKLRAPSAIRHCPPSSSKPRRGSAALRLAFAASFARLQLTIVVRTFRMQAMRSSELYCRSTLEGRPRQAMLRARRTEALPGTVRLSAGTSGTPERGYRSAGLLKRSRRRRDA